MRKMQWQQIWIVNHWRKLINEREYGDFSTEMKTNRNNTFCSLLGHYLYKIFARQSRPSVQRRPLIKHRAHTKHCENFKTPIPFRVVGFLTFLICVLCVHGNEMFFTVQFCVKIVCLSRQSGTLLLKIQKKILSNQWKIINVWVFHSINWNSLFHRCFYNRKSEKSNELSLSWKKMLFFSGFRELKEMKHEKNAQKFI